MQNIFVMSYRMDKHIPCVTLLTKIIIFINIYKSTKYANNNNSEGLKNVGYIFTLQRTKFSNSTTP